MAAILKTKNTKTMTTMEEKKLEILYDHYKDTFENIKTYLQKRNIYTLSTIVLVIFLSIELASPTISTDVSSELIKKNIGDIKIDYGMISSVILFALMWSVLLYYQINFLIEKMYVYLHKIEGDLSKQLIPYEIGREGKNYLNNYPILSSVAHRIYTWLFPISILIVAITKWITEKAKVVDWRNGHFLFDTLILFIIVLISLLYLSNRHFNDFHNKEEEDPEVGGEDNAENKGVENNEEEV